MSYAVLMVHVGAGRIDARRIRLAVDLADRFHARLIGIAGRLYLPPFLAEAPAVGAERNDGERKEMMDVLADMGKKFHAAAKHIEHVEWRGISDDANSIVAREARRIVVAWKDSREARRAVRDALPFLKRAKEATIVTACEHGTETQAIKHIEDVENYLARHKVIVGEKAFLHTEQSIATELLRFAKEEKADLIVAGGYGHSRLGEWALGGVTRELLSKSALCCLFSH